MTHRAEGRLGKEGGRELMTLDIMDFGLFDGSPALVQGEEAFSLAVRQVLCIWGGKETEHVLGYPVLIGCLQKMQLLKY